jgi:hypothetical protein
LHSLTEKSSYVFPILGLLCVWGEGHLGERIKYWCDEEDESSRPASPTTTKAESP